MNQETIQNHNKLQTISVLVLVIMHSLLQGPQLVVSFPIQ